MAGKPRRLQLPARDPWQKRVPHLDCDGTLKLTRHWMGVHGIHEATTIPELEERGGSCNCEVLFCVADAPREWLQTGDGKQKELRVTATSEREQEDSAAEQANTRLARG